MRGKGRSNYHAGVPFIRQKIKESKNKQNIDNTMMSVTLASQCVMTAVQIQAICQSVDGLKAEIVKDI